MSDPESLVSEETWATVLHVLDQKKRHNSSFHRHPPRHAAEKNMSSERNVVYILTSRPMKHCIALYIVFSYHLKKENSTLCTTFCIGRGIAIVWRVRPHPHGAQGAHVVRMRLGESSLPLHFGSRNNLSLSHHLTVTVAAVSHLN